MFSSEKISKTPWLLFFVVLFFYSCTSVDHSARNGIKKQIKNSWKGKWERDIWQNGGQLEITNITGDSLNFALSANSGGNSGEIEGKALGGDNIATFISADAYDTCVINFELYGDTMISITQKQGNCGAGLGVEYSGNYYRMGKHIDSEKGSTNDLGLLNAFNDSLLRKLTGDAYAFFINSTQLTSEDTDLDNFKAKVFSSGVRGLYTSMENIIMIDSSKNIWAAVINNDTVLYYTNNKDYIKKLPKTIDNWRANFKTYPVIYKSKN